MIDRARFEREIAAAGRPAVMRGLIRDWPVRTAAAAGDDALVEYLGRHDAGVPLSTYVGSPAIGGRFFYDDGLTGLNFDRGRAPFRQVAQLLLDQRGRAGVPSVYAGAAAAGDHFPGFASENAMPLLPAEVSPRLWIGNATRISTHYDVADNIACCVAGRRRFTLFPPEQVANLYVGPLENTISGQPVSMVDPLAPDLVRHPRFAAALEAAMVVDLEPGDALFVPSLWWHHVEAFGEVNLLVNYWWNTPHAGSPFEALIHAMLTVRDLPPRERNAWRAFFDHLVFDADETTAAHLPPAAQGVLGAPSPSRTAMVRDFLARGLQRLR